MRDCKHLHLGHLKQPQEPEIKSLNWSFKEEPRAPSRITGAVFLSANDRQQLYS